MIVARAGNVVMLAPSVVSAADDCDSLDAAAQQLSACTCVIARFEPEPCDSDLCIGQLVAFMQHAIRASGVPCHPAQTAAFPTHSVRTESIAAKRLTSSTTHVECATASAMSMRRARIRTFR